jgi:hypothetical protein
LCETKFSAVDAAVGEVGAPAAGDEHLEPDARVALEPSTAAAGAGNARAEQARRAAAEDDDVP